MKEKFRITAYHPTKDISVIIDSHGRFEKLWQFSSHLLTKGFKVLEVEKLENGKLPVSDKLVLVSAKYGGSV